MKDIHRLSVYRALADDPVVCALQSLADEGEPGTFFELCALLLAPDCCVGPGEYLAKQLVAAENSFTLCAERGTPYPFPDVVESDLSILCSIAVPDLEALHSRLPLCAGHEELLGSTREERYAPLVQALTRCDPAALREALTSHIRRYGAGRLNGCDAFVYADGLRPIQRTDPVRFEDLLGLDAHIKTLRRNTEAFLSGRRALHALLYGDRGTGKSSLVKAVLNEYRDRGLKMIEVNKEHLRGLKSLLEILRERGGHYVLFLDDLSFEDDENDYKSLKALIQGELEDASENILVYATSNRRHLIRENWSDRLSETGEIHRSDSMEEKLSLADRFGILLTFSRPDADGYLTLVHALAARAGLALDEAELERKAKQWELAGHGMSGRSAGQFITSLLMEEEQS